MRRMISLIIVCAMALSAMSFAACGGVSELIPGGANRAPVIEESPGQPGTFLITVYAENGSVIVFETGRGIKQEATVKNSDSITFKAGTGALLPDEPIEGPTCEVAPKIYIKDAFGQERLIENMPTVTLEVPSVTVAYDNPDTVVSEDGTVTISGVIDNSEAELTIGGERVNVGADGSFTSELFFEDAGDYTVDIEGLAPGYRIYRHTVAVTVEQVVPEVSLIELPWEYGDSSYSQRVKNSSETIAVRAMAPVGSEITVSCESSNAVIDNPNPSVGEDGVFSFNVNMKYAGDYVLHMVCTTDSGQVSERDMHVQRQPDYSSYRSGALAANYDALSSAGKQAYKIKGSVTEMIQEGDFVLAMLDMGDGNMVLLEYHNHYGSAGTLAEGNVYSEIFGRSDGVDDEYGVPRIYVWFIDG